MLKNITHSKKKTRIQHITRHFSSVESLLNRIRQKRCAQIISYTQMNLNFDAIAMHINRQFRIEYLMVMLMVACLIATPTKEPH